MGRSTHAPDETDTIEAFHAAALGQGTWLSALELFSALTGSHRGQLIGFGAGGAVTFNWMNETDPQMFIDLEQAGGNDPLVNSRIRIGLTAPLLGVLDEADFETEEDVRRHPAYGEELRRWDAPYLCLTNLVRTPEMSVGLSVTRRRNEGGLSAEDKQLFGRIALHARQAVRTQAFLGEHAAGLIAGALESVSLTCFVCARDGSVLALTSASERLLAAGDRLRLREGRLMPAYGDGAALAKSLLEAGVGAGPPPRPVVVRDATGYRPLALEVTPLPFGRWPAAFDQARLVIVREPKARSARKAALIASTVFRFTQSETAVAERMLSGQSVQEIADSLGVGAGTVRTHVRRLYEKADVSNQLMFAAVLNAFC